MNAGVDLMPNLRGDARMTTGRGLEDIYCMAPTRAYVAPVVRRVALTRGLVPFAQLGALILHPFALHAADQNSVRVGVLDCKIFPFRHEVGAQSAPATCTGRAECTRGDAVARMPSSRSSR